MKTKSLQNPATLAQFEAFTRQRTALPGAPAAAAPAAAAVEEGSRRPLPRYVVLMIDDVHLAFGNLALTKKALASFLAELDPEDMVALVTTSGASARHEFTTDRAVLRQAVGRPSVGELRPEQLWAPRLTEYQAELIERGDSEALDVAVQEILQQRQIPDPESEAKLKARRVLEEAVFSAQLTLETTESLIGGMARLPGRKLLFLLSDGFVTGLTAGSPLSYDIRRITDAGTRAGVVVYALETRGLTVRAVGGSASSWSSLMPRTLGNAYSMQWRSEEATRNAMNAIASGTGGFLVHSVNDLRAGLRQMLADTETYYVLAYEPTNTKRDGGFRKIEVRLLRHSGWKVRARSGYFAADTRRAEAVAGAPVRPASNPVRLAADFVSLEGGASDLVLSGHVDATMLPFVREGERYHATIELLATVLDERGVVVTTLPPERAELDLTEAEHARVVSSGLAYQKMTPLKPARYRARLVARGAAGRLGGVEKWVEIPDLTEGHLDLSSVFLLKATGTGAPDGPQDAPQLQNAQAQRRFRRDEDLYVQVYPYNAKRDASGAANLVAQAEILRGGVVLATAAPEPIVVAAPQGPPLPHTSRIKLRLDDLATTGLPEYELRLTVTDRNADETAARLVDFRID